MNQQSQQIGITRLIERPGRTPYVQTEALVCPCCGHLTRIEWPQDNGLRITTQTHCTRSGCPGYQMTSNVLTFFERFGTTSHDQNPHLEKVATV